MINQGYTLPKVARAERPRHIQLATKKVWDGEDRPF